MILLDLVAVPAEAADAVLAQEEFQLQVKVTTAALVLVTLMAEAEAEVPVELEALLMEFQAEPVA
jgi:hypothetical protein